MDKSSSKKVLISGSTGLLGSATCESLAAQGCKIVRLVRREVRPGENAISWDPAAGKLNATDLEGFDAIVHLSGENIATGHWTAARRKRIWDSRVESTRLLCNALETTKSKPKVLVCASGSGWYGEGGERELSEDLPAGEDCFFVNLVREWEAATQPAAAAGIRVVNLRIGVVLTPEGGALKQMLPAFRLGLGAVIGSGKQHTGWLTLRELVNIVQHALATESVRGPVNCVAPRPVTQNELGRTLGKVLNRPVLLHVPLWVVRLILSPEMAEAVGWSQRLVPAKLAASGYRFRDPDLEAALRELLGR
ncbi:TIGR01777 family oxidoreductase [bacterium]|nr:TIGR01777 family oxidoreductase [bacterium]MBU1984685.1 TIGR01777 family oxidoreductase [bacterium]